MYFDWFGWKKLLRTDLKEHTIIGEALLI